MIRLLRDFRFIPIALIATSRLFALKLFGLAIDGGYTFDDVAARSADDVEVTGSVRDKKERDEPVKITREPPPKPSWAHEMFNFPDITGSVAGGSPPPQSSPAPIARHRRSRPMRAAGFRCRSRTRSRHRRQSAQFLNGYRSGATSSRRAIVISTCAKI